MSKISKILILGFMVGGIFCSALVVQIAFPETFMEKGAAQSELPIFVKKQPIEKTGRALYAPDEIIVKFKASTKKQNVENFNNRQEAVEIRESPYAHFKVLKIPKTKTVEEMVEIYKKNPNVEYAEPNFIYCASWYPNDQIYRYQWHFDDDNTNNPGGVGSNPYGGANGGGIRMEEAWPITSGTPSVTVAVIDTGVAYENYPVPSYELGTIKNGVTMYLKAPDLTGTNFVSGYDYVHNDAHANDNNSHGTHVCGTIAQTTDNTTGVAGIAYNTSIMPVKVLDQAGCGYLDDVAEGINFAAANGAKVINLSLGGSDTSIALENAVANAYNSGVTIIAASGNGSSNQVSYPAAYDAYVIAVGATRYDETRASYSNYGASLDLVAPGGDNGKDQNKDGYGDGVLQNTFTSYKDDGDPWCVSPNDTKADPTDFGYWFLDGTSMSAPHVAGVAALLLAQNSSRTPDDIRDILQSTAEDKGDAGWDQYYGHGLLDAAAALTSTPIISISIENDAFDYGILPLSASSAEPVKKSTIDLGKTPVIENTGNVSVDLAVKSSDALGGSAPWNLVASAHIGKNKFCYQYRTTTGSAWYDFPVNNNYTGTVFAGLGTNDTTTLDLQTLMPTGSNDPTQKSITVTILATESE
jgi:serine protease